MKNLKSGSTAPKSSTKILFSEYFNIEKTQEDLPFVDIFINADKKLFLDPAKLLKYDDDLSISMSNHIVAYFNKFLTCVRAGDKINGMKMLKYLREPKELHLGYAVNGYQGNAVGGIKGTHIYEKFSQSEAVKTGLLKDLEESALLVKGIDRDVISDMTAMICKADLMAFTQQQCEKLQVPMSKCKVGNTWLGNDKWLEVIIELPTYNGHPIILVPKNFVTNILTLDSQDFYRNEILSSIQESLMRADKSLIVLLKNGKRRCAITKKELKADDEYRFSKDLIYTIVQKQPEILRGYRHRKKYTQDDINEH